MSGLQFNLGTRNGSSKPGGTGATIFLILFATPFAGFGLVALVEGVRKLIAGETKDGAMLCLFGLIFSGVGLGLLFAAIWARKKSRQSAELRARYPDKPWLLRPDWAAGRIKSSATAQMNVFLIMGLSFCGIGGLAAASALPKELHKGNYAVLLVLLFPLVGIGFLAAFAAAWRSRRRFGDCFFDPAQIPAPLGGILEGMIQTGTRLRLEHDLHLKLSCLRRVTTGSGKSRSTEEHLLWQDEKIYTSQAALPEPEPGRTGVPVHFKLPADQPESTPDHGDGIHWRLEARTKMSGPDFHVVFSLPVFKVAGAVAADADAPGADEPDPTAALQAPIEEIRHDERSQIQVSDGPDGREFYFPAARNIGAALFVTAMTFVFIGIVIFLLQRRTPVVFPIVFGLASLLLVFGTFTAWFKSSRVTINSSTVRATNGWLLFRRTREFPANDVARFTTRIGMQSGTQTFTDIRLVKRGGDKKLTARVDEFRDTFQAAESSGPEKVVARFRETAAISGVTVASGIASAAEANWLVQEMTKALGRRA